MKIFSMNRILKNAGTTLNMERNENLNQTYTRRSGHPRGWLLTNRPGSAGQSRDHR